MLKEYTTGELANICGVTKRTVQYYDKEKIVVPSKMSNGGRRIYTEDDLKKFQLVCLYKNLGLSLHEIKGILESDNQYSVVMELLNNQQEKIAKQIHDLKELHDKLATISNEIYVSKTISIKSDEELKNLYMRKKQHNKIDRLTYLLLGCYMIIMLLSFRLSSFIDDIYVYFIIGTNILLLCILIYIHVSQNAYVCPKCHKKFTITFLKDLLTLNNGKKGKYLKCPYCHQKNWIAETYKDD